MKRILTILISVLMLGVATALPAQAAPFVPLTDLQTTTSGPFDGASAKVVSTSHNGSTTFTLIVRGIDTAAAGTTFGAHLHVGTCVRGNGALAGPHYNSTGQPPVTISDQTEVWLDFTVTAGGTGTATTTVPFVPESGTRAVVIHQEPTQPNGTAGARQACLPVQLP